MEMQMGGQLAGWVKGKVPRSLGLSVHQKILPILPSMPHSGCPCRPDRHPWLSLLRGNIYCGNHSLRRKERGGEVVSRQRWEYNIDSQELVVVKLYFLKFNFMSVLLRCRQSGMQLHLTNLQERFYIRNKAPRWGCTVCVIALKQWHVQKWRSTQRNCLEKKKRASHEREKKRSVINRHRD